MSEATTDAPQPTEETTATPADMPAQKPTNGEKPDGEKSEADEALRKAHAENFKLRAKLREVEPLAKKAQEVEEAGKSEVQKALDRAAKAEKDFADQQIGFLQMEFAVKYHLPAEDIEFVGSGTREEMEGRAKRIAAKNAAAIKANPPPPSDRPVEGLRPGATSEPAKTPDDSYPSEWAPVPHERDKNSRTQYGI